MPADRVEYLLRAHPRYFVNVGGKSLYSLNGFSVDRGSRLKFAADIDAALRESSSWVLRVLFVLRVIRVALAPADAPNAR